MLVKKNICVFCTSCVEIKNKVRRRENKEDKQEVLLEEKRSYIKHGEVARVLKVKINERMGQRFIVHGYCMVVHK